MPDWSEKDIKNAEVDVSNGKPARKAVKDWGIPYTNLYHRITPGKKTCRQAKQDVPQKWSLAAWAISQAELRFPVTRPQIKEFALKVLSA
ncbi:hypothetical protein COL516b_003946 [Colletotrichum fioriniae]|nr:uncharacterized protein COL516b_003946 [Colletotrichum fioriniae]KAJ0307333.1 hypothetical protein COL516b_003946 [Colletotrichum fioriniae]